MNKTCNNYERSEEEEKQMGKKNAARFNSGKIRYDLIPPYALEQVARIYTFGSLKYSDNNWWKGFKWRKDTFGCILRHIYKWVRGESIDPESGVHHLAHAAWNCFALIEFEKNDIGIDDRNPYSLDLVSKEEQSLKISAWRKLANEGNEDDYNGLDFKLTKEDVNIN